jgi:hypothetical protein
MPSLVWDSASTCTWERGRARRGDRGVHRDRRRDRPELIGQGRAARQVARVVNGADPQAEEFQPRDAQPRPLPDTTQAARPRRLTPHPK